LRLQSYPEILDLFLKIILLVLHFLDSLVTLGEQALQAPHLRQQPAPNFEREL
jgi:hypothetical protein